MGEALARRPSGRPGGHRIITWIEGEALGRRPRGRPGGRRFITWISGRGFGQAAERKARWSSFYYVDRSE
jgi:hypothetical protein